MAKKLFHPPEAPGDEAEIEGIEADQYLVFSSNGQEYGVQAMRVQEISAPANITLVPRAPAHIAGILNLRGRLISVIDFRKRLGFPAAPPDEDTRIVIVEHAGYPIGLIVDSVEEVIRIPSDTVQQLPESMSSGAAEDFLTGIGILDRRLIVLIDADPLFRRADGPEGDGIRKAVEAARASASPATAQ